MLSKAVWVDVLGNEEPIFPYEQPAHLLHAAGVLRRLAGLGDWTPAPARPRRRRRSRTSTCARRPASAPPARRPH
ncbi:MAG: hypothetical protein MZV65_47515 [Chromatiales bacterium]|nr:hypothetical protein [Chromatiales bacterium]